MEISLHTLWYCYSEQVLGHTVAVEIVRMYFRNAEKYLQIIWCSLRMIYIYTHIYIYAVCTRTICREIYV